VVVDELFEVRRHVRAAPASVSDAVPPSREASARNLEHYLALRALELRPLQADLAELGLSSLGRAESNVMATIEATLRAALALEGSGPLLDSDLQGAPGPGEGRRLLEQNALTLLGPVPAGRRARIMVTLPIEAAGDPGLVRGLLAEQVELVRINGAAGDPEALLRMVDHVRAAGPEVRILLDLPGPKLRTGPMPAPASVLKVRPVRDEWGRVIEPGRLRFSAIGPPSVDAGLPVVVVSAPLPVRHDDAIDLVDTRGAHRRLRVVEVGPEWVEVAVPRTTYLAPGMLLRPVSAAPVEVAAVPVHVGYIELTAGDHVVVEANDDIARAGEGGWRIGCTLPRALDALEPGHRVLFDDGRIAGRVTRVDADGAEVVITHPVGRRSRLRGAKGINLPDSDVALPALTCADLRLLDHVAGEVDLVALSFVRHPEDVEMLRRALEDRQLYRLGAVLKIETLQGFHALPQLMAQLMAWPSAGVMIARGDLAVEVGYERLAEVQEEILWLCEAAHLPVIWATEVLDRLARTGSPTRAEISDAALADRAECVMLNKGPHVTEAVATLHDILGRMHGHMAKKQSLLRRLGAWA
jgi:pyruvate kinase